jgi:hypothetical protein
MYPWDLATPRFYSPGKHPALREWYARRDDLERMLSYEVEVEWRGYFWEQYYYVLDQIASFEERESELKAEAALKRDERQ